MVYIWFYKKYNFFVVAIIEHETRNEVCQQFIPVQSPTSLLGLSGQGQTFAVGLISFVDHLMV